MEDNNPVKIHGQYAAVISLTEIGLGSFLHAYRIPFSGHSLSLNQAFFLSKASQETKDFKSPIKVSLIVSLLKSFSPAGKRLTPMLAITMQGLLFSIGQIFLGANILGSLLGMILLSSWAFIQPVLVYLLIFGKDILFVMNYFLSKLNKFMNIEINDVLMVLLIIYLVKITLGSILIFLSYYVQSFNPISEKFTRSISFPKSDTTSLNSKLSWKTKLKLLQKDFCQPWFLISILMTFIYLIISDANQVKLIWYLARVIAMSGIIFYALRFFPLEKYLLKLTSKDSDMGKSIKYALAQLKRKTD